MGSRDSEDLSGLLRRAEVERRVARGVLDGRDEREICDLLGLGRDDVRSVVSRLAARVVSEGGEIARAQAIKQSASLQALYLDAQTQWEKTWDPRYAEVMRGALRDIRDIWGVDAAKRVVLGGSLDLKGGVLGGFLGELGDGDLDLLESIFTRLESREGDDGEGIPALEGLREAGSIVPVGRQ